jgi:hypothetical protein
MFVAVFPIVIIVLSFVDGNCCRCMRRNDAPEISMFMELSSYIASSNIDDVDFERALALATQCIDLCKRKICENGEGARVDNVPAIRNQVKFLENSLRRIKRLSGMKTPDLIVALRANENLEFLSLKKAKHLYAELIPLIDGIISRAGE